MNLKKFVLSVSVLMPAFSFSMDVKDGNGTPAQQAPAQEQPDAYVNPLDNESQQTVRNTSNQRANIAPNAVHNAPENQGNGLTCKKIGATLVGCALGVFCGYVTKAMWSKLPTLGLLEFPATLAMAFAVDEFGDRIGGSGPLATIAMVSSAVFLPYKKSTYVRNHVWTNRSSVSINGVSITSGDGIIRVVSN